MSAPTITVVLQKKGYYDPDGYSPSLTLPEQVEEDLLRLKKEKNDLGFLENSSRIIEQDPIFRSDPDLVRIVDSLTDENGNNEDFQLVQIPNEYKNCFTIKTRFRGWREFAEEYVSCDPKKLILHTLENLDLSTLNDQDRLKMLERLVTLAKK
jgi:hypothetical protein